MYYRQFTCTNARIEDLRLVVGVVKKAGKAENIKDDCTRFATGKGNRQNQKDSIKKPI